MLVIILVIIISFMVLGIGSVILEERDRKRIIEMSWFEIGDEVKLNTFRKLNVMEQRFIDKVGTVYDIQRYASGTEIIGVRYDNAHLYFDPMKIDKVSRR